MPPTSVRIHTGAEMAKASRPIRNDDAPRLRSNQGSATCCAQVPMFESRLAKQKVPKRRVRSRLREFLKALIGFPNEGWRARNRRAFPPDLLMMAVTTLFVHDDVKRNNIFHMPMASVLFCA